MKYVSGYRHFRNLCRTRIRLALADWKRKKIHATVIAITGSSAKSTTTLLLTHILNGTTQTRSLALSNDVIAAAKEVMSLRKQDNYFVVEAGASSPGSLAQMAKVIRPDVSIVTLVALEHKSSFLSVEGVMHEKAEIVAAVQPGGFALLNADDPLVMRMASRTSQRIVTFGQKANADYRAENISSRFPHPFTMRIIWHNDSLELSAKFVGEHFWLPIVAAVASAIELGVPKQVIVDRVATFEPVFGRCNVVSIPDGPTFILDTTKAPWHSLLMSFDIVEKAQASRKRIVLGHISDYAGSNTKYRDAYHAAREIADEVIFVGNHSHRSQASAEDRANGRFREFSSPQQLAEYIRKTAVPGELIFVKGSGALHLERIGIFMRDTVECWPTNCGKKGDCFRCGLYHLPYIEHRGRKPTWRTKVFGHKRDKRAAQNSTADTR